MSVYKSRRKDAAAQYIADARELRIITTRVVRRFPTSYRWIVTNNILELAVQIYTNCVRANAIYVHKDISKNDFELRRRYLRIAETAADALLADITFCYELVADGNNFFRDKEEYDRIFSRWTEQGNITLKRIRKLLDSDKQRFSTYQKAKAAAEAKPQ